VDAIDALAHHALRAPQRINSLGPALRAAPAFASAASLYEDPRTSARAAAEAAPSRATGPAESCGSGLSRDGIVAISESAACVGTTVAGLRESARGRLAHCYCADHLNGVRGGGLSELPARLRNILIFGSDFGGILRLTV
jgi:hypothetical protein